MDQSTQASSVRKNWSHQKFIYDAN